MTFRFPHPGTGQIVEHSLSLDEALHLPWQKPIDEQSNVVAVERQVHDRLRVQPLQPNSMYEVSSKWMGNVSGYRTGLQAGEYDLIVNLLNSSQDDSVLTTHTQIVAVDASGGFRPTNIEVALPKSEGAYAVEFTLRRKRMLPSFVASKSSLTRAALM